MKIFKKIMLSFVLLTIFGFGLLWQVIPVHGQDASPSAETTKNLKDRIQRVVKEREEDIKGAIEDLSKKKHGFIGEVERISGEVISVKTVKETRIIALDGVNALLKGSKEITAADIAVGDWLIVMGITEDDNFVAKRIIASSESLRPKSYKVALGGISEIDKTTTSFLARSESESKTLTFNKSTSYQDLEGNKIKASQLSEDMQVLVIYYQEDEKGSQQTKKVVTVIRALSALETDEE